MPRPEVTLHFAQSLDGRIGGPRGAPRALLSGEAGFERAHRARAAHDAVLVGIGTVLVDDPRLTVRLCDGRDPRRVILDAALRVPGDARALARAGAGAHVTVIGVTTRAPADRAAALRASGVDVCLVPPDGEGRVPIAAALDALAERDVRALLVEGGSAVLTSFLRAGVVDQVEIEIAPVIAGGRALPAFGELGAGVPPPRLAPGFTVARAGDSVVVRGRPVAGGGA